MPEHSSLGCLRGEQGKENVPPLSLNKEKLEYSPSPSPRKVSFAQKREGGNPLTQRKRRLQTILTTGKFGGPSRASRAETVRVREDNEEFARPQEPDLHKHHGDEDDNTQGSINTVVAAMAFANSSPDHGSRISAPGLSLKGLLEEVADKSNQQRHAPASPAESVRSTMRGPRRGPRQAPSPTLSISSRRRQGLHLASLSDSPPSSSATTFASTSGVSLFPSGGSVSSANSHGSLKSRLSSRSSTTSSSPLLSANNTVIPGNLKSLLHSSTPLHHSRSATTSPSSLTTTSTMTSSVASSTSSSASVIARTGGSLMSRLQALNATPSATSYLSASIAPDPLETSTDRLPSVSSSASDHSAHTSTTAPAPSLQSSSTTSSSVSSSASLSSHATPAATLRSSRPSSSVSSTTTPSVSSSILSTPSTAPAPSSLVRSRSSSLPASAPSSFSSSALTPSPLASTSTQPASSTASQSFHTASSQSNNTNNTIATTGNSASLPPLTTLPSISSLSLNSGTLPTRSSSSSSSSSSLVHSAPSVHAQSSAPPQSASSSSQPSAVHHSSSSSTHPSSSAPQPPVSHHSSSTSTSSKYRKDKEEVHFVNGKQYFVLELIGQGGSSKVYRVLSKDKKVYALKRISLGGEVNHAADYHNEIALLQRLKGRPYVIQLIESQEDLVAGVIYMVFELGTMDLAQYLQANQNSKTWDNNSIRYFWKQMLECTQMCHDEKILHLDLKPPNFVLVDGSLKLIDFGIAKEVQADMTHILNENNVGTLDYMSPESVVEYKTAGLPSGTQAHKLGRSSDVWSLGCILYQMVYKIPPFKKLSLMQKMWALMDPKLVVKFGPCDDPALLQVMKACLQYDPKNRPTISQLLDHPYLMPKHDVVSKQHLEHILQQLGVSNFQTMAEGVLTQIRAGQPLDVTKFLKTEP